MEDLKTKKFLVVADGYIPQRHCCVRIVDEVISDYLEPVEQK